MAGGETALSATWPFINPRRPKPGGAPWRETLYDVPDMPAARVRFRRSEAPPPFSYAITLEVAEGEELRTVRLWDNAHASDEHHEHAYTRAGGKQDPTIRRKAGSDHLEVQVDE